MSRVTMHKGMGFSKTTNALFTTDKEFSHVGNTLADQNDMHEWALWGSGNLEPVTLAALINTVAVLSGTLKSKVRMAIGKGLEPFLLTSVDSEGNEQLEHISDPEITAWLQVNKVYKYSYETIYNLLAYGWAATQIVLSNDRKTINRIKATDTYTARLKKKNAAGFIETMYMHADWNNMVATSAQDKAIVQVPLLKEDYELEDLQERTTGAEFAMLHRFITDGAQYYPAPLWKSAQKWAEVSQSVPAFKKALNTNQMSIKYLIHISDKYWETHYKNWKTFTAEEKDAEIEVKYNEINTWLVGEANTGKSIIAGTYYDPHTKQEIKDITIEVIDDKFKDGKYLPDGAAGDKQIMFALIYNPAIAGANLFGDGASGGGGSGSDIREAFLVQLMLMHAERTMNLEVFDLVKQYNGWAERLETGGKQLVFRYKSGLLTTLDTGGSTKPATT